MPSGQQWIHVAIIIIVASMSLIGWGLRQFREYQAKQQFKVATQWRQEQVMRTGRGLRAAPNSGRSPAPTLVPNELDLRVPPHSSGGSVHDEARRRLQELALKRKAELEAMARRAAGGAGHGGRAVPVSAPTRPVRAAPIPPSQTQKQRRPGQSAPALPPQRAANTASDNQRGAERQARNEKQANAQEKRRLAENERASRVRTADQNRAEGNQPEASDGSGDGTDSVRRPASAPGAVLAALRLGNGVPAGNLEHWRRAIVLMEVLGQAPGMRSPNEPPTGPARMF